jgi:hypothetical protein
MAKYVRIQPESYSKLRHLATESGATMSQVLAEAIDELYRQRFLEACNLAFARLRADPTAWSQEKTERQEWETTLSDGFADCVE